jgi:hypothetical protein
VEAGVVEAGVVEAGVVEEEEEEDEEGADRRTGAGGCAMRYSQIFLTTGAAEASP